MSDPFDAYAAYYDLLYRDKDYAGEVDYLHDLIRQHAPGAQDVLELGCGTGMHAVHFARLGYDILGIDISVEMLARAQALGATLPAPVAARMQFEPGDVRTWQGRRRFDVVLSLFHVFSYQVAQADIRAAFATAAAHLHPRGILLLDFWYGPAVVAIGPEARVKRLEIEAIRLARAARPESFPGQNRVDVHYEIQVEDRATGDVSRFSEIHRMRYFFVQELHTLLAEAGLEPLFVREWLTDREPSADSWSALLAARPMA